MHLPHVTPFAKSPLYFFTACTAGRRCLLTDPVANQGLYEVWHNSADQDGWYVGRYVLMPYHMHFFAVAVTGANPREVWCKMWKSVTARRLAQKLYLQAPIWQEDTFDHILRSEESYEAKWHYVRENPVGRGSVLLRRLGLGRVKYIDCDSNDPANV